MNGSTDSERSFALFLGDGKYYCRLKGVMLSLREDLSGIQYNSDYAEWVLAAARDTGRVTDRLGWDVGEVGTWRGRR